MSHRFSPCKRWPLSWVATQVETGVKNPRYYPANWLEVQPWKNRNLDFPSNSKIWSSWLSFQDESKLSNKRDSLTLPWNWQRVFAPENGFWLEDDPASWIGGFPYFQVLCHYAAITYSRTRRWRQFQKGKIYNSKEHVHIESFVTTLIDWTFVLMTPTKWAFVEVMCSDLACGWFWGDRGELMWWFATQSYIQTFTKYCTCHEKWHLNFTKYCACHEARLTYLVLITYETSFTVRGATGVTIQPHQILRLPRKMTGLLYRPDIWNVISNARSNRCHYPTSPNTAPATQKDSHT